MWAAPARPDSVQPSTLLITLPESHSVGGDAASATVREIARGQFEKHQGRCIQPGVVFNGQSTPLLYEAGTATNNADPGTHAQPRCRDPWTSRRRCMTATGTPGRSMSLLEDAWVESQRGFGVIKLAGSRRARPAAREASPQDDDCLQSALVCQLRRWQEMPFPTKHAVRDEAHGGTSQTAASSGDARK